MSELGIFVDFVIAVAAAFVGGMLAQRLRQPVILGYLLAGIAIGHYTPGPIGDQHNVQLMAEMGVAFLMFALGAEFSPSELYRLRWVAGVGGVLQIAATILLGLAVSPLLGLSGVQGIFLGSVLALSSTMVALKLLMNRGELESLHGHIVTGILILQDLSVVPMMIILPALADPMDSLLFTLAAAGAKAAAILAGGWLLGSRAVPWALHRVASTGSRELFLLSIITLSLGTAILTYSLGLSIAFGAFMAGLIISESDYGHRALAEVIPLRDIFASIFFVSVGMLIDPRFLFSNAGPILLVTTVVVVGKLIITTAVPLIFGYSGKDSLMTGLSLAQIGEFSFVLTTLGQARGVIDASFGNLILASALVSILVNPLLMHFGQPILRALSALPGLGNRFTEKGQEAEEAGSPGLSDHVVVCGYGRVAQEAVDVLREQGEEVIVIELDPHVVAELRRLDIPHITGDSAIPSVLAHAGVERAKLVLVTVPDTGSAEQVIRAVRTLNSSVRILARTHHPEDLDDLLAAGADEAICPEYQAELEFLRHTMSQLGTSHGEVSEILSRRRDPQLTVPAEG